MGLKIAESVCTGIDLFNSEPTPNTLAHYIESVKIEAQSTPPLKRPFPNDLRKLISSNTLPQFVQGNVVRNHNLPQNIDFAYCKKLLVNLLGMKYEDTLSGEERLLAGLKHIKQSIRPNGLACVIEYDPEFKLRKYIDLSGLCVLTQTQFNRRG